MLTVRQAKGLEFDSVLVVDPAGILAESPRGTNDLYVALTRSTQRLGVLPDGPLPADAVHSGRTGGGGELSAWPCGWRASGPVRTVVLDRPEVRNAVDRDTADALVAAFEGLDADGDGPGRGAVGRRRHVLRRRGPGRRSRRGGPIGWSRTGRVRWARPGCGPGSRSSRR